MEPELLRATRDLQNDIAQKKNKALNIERDLDERLLALETLYTEKKKLEADHEDVTKHLAKNHDVPIKLRYIMTNLHVDNLVNKQKS